MKIKLFTTSVILLLITFYSCQKIENPKNICKDCGSFDLSKITFTEKISDLTAKTEVWKSAIVNDDNELKSEEEVTKKDVAKLYKYSFANAQNLILGSKPFTYNGHFDFNSLQILTDPKNKIIAFNATIFYDGKMEDINDFVEYLKKENKSMKMTKNGMLGDLTVYQWFSDDRIIQLVKDNTEGVEETMIDGKTTKKKSTYVKLTIYDSSFLKNAINTIVDRDIDFVLYHDSHFIKN